MSSGPCGVVTLLSSLSFPYSYLQRGGTENLSRRRWCNVSFLEIFFLDRGISSLTKICIQVIQRVEEACTTYLVFFALPILGLGPERLERWTLLHGCWNWGEWGLKEYNWNYINSFAPSSSKLSRQSCWVACLLVCAPGWDFMKAHSLLDFVYTMYTSSVVPRSPICPLASISWEKHKIRYRYGFFWRLSLFFSFPVFSLTCQVILEAAQTFNNA